MDLSEKAGILIEALPYIKKYQNKKVVIKFGGNAMDEMMHVIEDIVLLKSLGIKPIVVHGGGPEVDAEMQKMKIEPKFINGLRYTNESIIKVVERVFNKINSEIVSNIKAHNAKSVNANGHIKVKQKDEKLGLVGEITEINKDAILKLVNRSYVPVISPLGKGEDGKTYNINADTVAACLAVKLKAEKLTILTNVNGVVLSKKHISHLNFDIAEKEIKKGNINRGMIPKVEACIYAVRHKCPKAHLINGLVQHSLLLEIFTDKGVGTEIVP